MKIPSWNTLTLILMWLHDVFSLQVDVIFALKLYNINYLIEIVLCAKISK
jgi:hypothetical protein